jgi:hypothetical protein
VKELKKSIADNDNITPLVKRIFYPILILRLTIKTLLTKSLNVEQEPIPKEYKQVD